MLSTLEKTNIQRVAEHQIVARSSAFANPLAGFLARLAPELIRDEVKLRKADDESTILTLEELIQRFGLRQAGDAFERGQLIVGRSTTAREPTLSDFAGITGGMRDRAGEVIRQTRRSVREEIKRIVDEAQADATPSPTELVRELNRRINAERGFDGAFTWERAMRIARTELAIAENTAMVEGYKAAGADGLEWLAYKSPIFKRRHDLMSGIVIGFGERFKLPSGETCAHPGDASLSVGELAHCRCSSAPKVSRPGRARA